MSTGKVKVSKSGMLTTLLALFIFGLIQAPVMGWINKLKGGM